MAKLNTQTDEKKIVGIYKTRSMYESIRPYVVKYLRLSLLSLTTNIKTNECVKKDWLKKSLIDNSNCTIMQPVINWRVTKIYSLCIAFEKMLNVKCNNDYSIQNDESLRKNCTNERRVRKRDKKVRRDVI